MGRKRKGNPMGVRQRPVERRYYCPKCGQVALGSIEWPGSVTMVWPHTVNSISFQWDSPICNGGKVHPVKDRAP